MSLKPTILSRHKLTTSIATGATVIVPCRRWLHDHRVRFEQQRGGEDSHRQCCSARGTGVREGGI
jgi:hypothetical protein